jgi:hypothetical protein
MLALIDDDASAPLDSNDDARERQNNRVALARCHELGQRGILVGHLSIPGSDAGNVIEFRGMSS